MKIICILIALAANAHAGGDYVAGKITSFTEHNGNYSFHFVQTSTRTAMIPDCQDFEVVVTYRRVPWFSWLPFIRTAHPTRTETIRAAESLSAAQQDSREILFGFMGYGLVPTEKACSFESWGLKIFNDPGKQGILSYHDLI